MQSFLNSSINIEFVYCILTGIIQVLTQRHYYNEMRKVMNATPAQDQEVFKVKSIPMKNAKDWNISEAQLIEDEEILDSRMPGTQTTGLATRN